MTPDEQVAFVEAALTEAGWPDIYVWWNAEKQCVEGDALMPEAVWWQACELLAVRVGRRHACWPCWLGETPGDGTRCRNGNCAHPDEDRYPPRALLQRPTEMAR